MAPVLFPTDDSACADRARPWADRLAAALGAPLHVLRVEVGGAADLAPTALPDLAEDDVAENLGMLRSDDARGPERPVEARRRAADPARAILAYAEEVDARLVVMGTHGRSGFDRFVMGSVADHVLRRAPCPVLAVPAAAPDGTWTNGHVVVADDLTEAAERALAEAVRLARALGGTLAAIHVVEEARIPSPYGMLSAPLTDFPLLRPRVELALQKRAADAAGPGVLPAEIAVRSGDTVDEIVAYASERGAALVVVGSHGRKALDRVLLGSVAEALVRRAAYPVLVVRTSAPS